ncbi:unnamed protein product [Moneuplotes crassus]|uniref:Secreted protein n=1 Tax=Euplotes crassus TaxID=5936 RepID=A0AAD1X4Z7_EUPCR|nr:unnamed protein product [Moneuplotes crassus]
MSSLSCNPRKLNLALVALSLFVMFCSPSNDCLIFLDCFMLSTESTMLQCTHNSRICSIIILFSNKRSLTYSKYACFSSGSMEVFKEFWNFIRCCVTNSSNELM